MNDLISRQAAIDMVLEYAKRLREPIGTPEDNEMYSYGRGLLIGIERNLKQLPSAERKGRLEDIVEMDSGGYPFKVGVCCSACGFKTLSEDRYCPHCGVKMDGGGDE